MTDLNRIKIIENRIREIYKEKFNFDVPEIFFDIIPDQKMLEIMAYRNPCNISSWKYGRDYERMKTIHDHVSSNLPYEVVIFSDPYRAYLMKSNNLAVHILTIAHVYGHVIFMENNKTFRNTRKDLSNILLGAQKRFIEYESIYGIDEVEKVIDAGHALQMHSSPFDTETEEEKRKRIYEHKKKNSHAGRSEFGDILKEDEDKKTVEDNYYNTQLLKAISKLNPVEPTSDILRFIIDNSKNLENWQKDILEILRIEGQYYWPIIRTKYINEGWSCFLHEKILDILFKENLLNDVEHGQYNYSNSLVKAQHRLHMNPYLVGSELWKSIEDRWNKGKFGPEYDNCTNMEEKKNWNKNLNLGWEKCIEIMRSYNDWFFIQDFLTEELIEDLEMYLYVVQENPISEDYRITDHKPKDIKNLIVKTFATSGIPRIEITNGNYQNRGYLYLKHSYDGLVLDKKNAEETLKHITYLWGNDVFLETVYKKKDQVLHVKINRDNALNPFFTIENL